MKSSIYIIILSFLSLPIWAQPITKLNIHLNKQPIQEFIKQVEGQSAYHFYYNQQILDSVFLSIDIKNGDLKEVLDKALFNTGLEYAVFERAIFLTKNQKILTTLPYLSVSTDHVTVLENRKALAADITSATKRQPSILETTLQLIGNNADTTKSTGTLAGYIKNIDTGEPVAGVAIFIKSTQIGAITDAFGFYSLTMPKGRYELNIKAVGLKDTRRNILLEGDGKLDINVQEEPFSLKEVVITSEKAANIRRNQMGVEKLDIKTIKQVPTVFGEADVLRVLLTLPGVKSVGESSTGFNVRGGSADQNLIQFNNATIYNPSHFFGFFSAFNPEVIKDVQLYKSSIPARFGGRLSSILEITGREGNNKEFAGSAGIGLITSRVNLEGPLVKNKSSFILGGRTTYSNWILNLLPDKAGYKGAKASFYDVNFNINHTQSEKNSFYATVYASNDESNLATDTVFQYSNQNIALRWKHIFNNKLFGIISGGRDIYSYNNYSNYKDDVDYRLKFKISQTNLKASFNYYPNAKWAIDFGGGAIYYENKPGSLEPFSDKSLVVADLLPKEQALESALFAEQSYELTNAFMLNAGIRFSIYNYLGPTNVNLYAAGFDKTDANITTVESFGKGKLVKTYGAPEFRFGARWAIRQDFSLKASFNTQRQYIHMLSNTVSVSPTDVWKLSDYNIAPQKGNQISLGLYKNFKSNTVETSIEGYFKEIANFLDYKGGATLILNRKMEQAVLPTTGKAYGLEFLVKRLTGKLNGWVSYTYSRTLLKTDDVTGNNSINEGRYYPANYDKPHDFTLVGNYRFSHRVSLSLNITYSTGRPITLPVGKYFYSGGERLLYSERNQYRIPDYFRSDISINILGNHRKTQLTHNSWTIGVYNLKGRKNVFSSYFASENKVINGYQLSIFSTAIPFINYNIRF